MSDNYTDVTSQSWFSRIGNALKGIIVGLVLILISIPLLFWNEGRAVKRTRTLEEGGGAVIRISADTVDPLNEGKLVHLTGKAVTDEILTDGEFGVSVPAIKLRRSVEMYQWKESREKRTKKKVGGGTKTTTTYSYAKVWAPKRINSSGFKHPEGHENPENMKYSDLLLTAEDVRVGAFRLSPTLIEKIRTFSPVTVDPGNLPSDKRAEAVPYNNSGYYIGKNPAAPEIGDLRVTFQAVYPAEISLIAAQVEDTFEPYETESGGSLELLEPGIHSPESMIRSAMESNRLLTWLLRFVGVFLMFAGFALVFNPLAVFADVIPILGSIAGAGAGLMAFLISAVVSTIIIALAWITFRPIIGVSVLIVTAGLVAFVIYKLKASKRKG